VIYFIQDATAHLIKIGFTVGEIADRIRALQTGNPAGLVLLGVAEGDKAEEGRLHQRFAAARERGEWFRPVPDLVKYVIENAGRADRRSVERRPWPLTIYLAGKIQKGDWRSAIVDGQRLDYEYVQLFGTTFMGSCTEQPAVDEWPILKNVIDGVHHYSGPYFVGCDHGCFHGNDSHGCGKEYDNHGCRVGWDIPAHCEKAVRSADVVFAWISANDCYGTIAEIGMAKALGKHVWVASDRHYRDMWFIYQLADEPFCSLMTRQPKDTLAEFVRRYQEMVVNA
jgi:hypothetical protein